MQYSDEKKEKLGRLEKKLYSRNAPDVIDAGRSEFKDSPVATEEVKTEWPELKANNFDELAAKVSHMAETKHNFINKIFAVSVVFFVIAAGIAAFVFLGGSNLVSSKNVDIQVSGPVSVPGGQEVSFDINVVNGNNVDLQSASLLIEYPEGVRSQADLSKELERERFALETVKSKQSYRQNIKLVFFGEKESVKQIKISLEYRVENSSALFYKEKEHEVAISSAPVVITPTYPKEVNSGQDISFDIEVASNSKDKIQDFLVKVEYPFGFVFKSSSPAASFTDNTWKFSNLNAGEKRTIKIMGSIAGQDNEERVFRVSAGTADEDDERRIAVPLSELTESILVKKPFIGIGASIEGKNGDATLRGGNSAMTELSIRNNLPSRLFNVSVEASFKGAAFNKLSVSAGSNGFFQSLNDTILWDKRSVSEFSDMGPGSEERLSFSLTPFVYASIPKGAKPEIEITIIARGERILESGSVEPVSSIEKRKIVLATDIGLSSVLARSVGNIENSGSIPPKIDKPTTYTVVWSISNSFNQVSNAEVRAILPSYVKWTNEADPSSESISFNPVTNEVVWQAGSILQNTGFGSLPKQVYFQIEFLPSSSQLGQTPMLLGEATLSGIDKITGLRVETRTPFLTTTFSTDPTFKQGDDKVGR